MKTICSKKQISIEYPTILKSHSSIVKIDVHDFAGQMKLDRNTISRRRRSFGLELVVKIYTVHEIPFLISSVPSNHNISIQLTVCQ
jgi:hypothetical protein